MVTSGEDEPKTIAEVRYGRRWGVSLPFKGSTHYSAFDGVNG